MKEKSGVPPSKGTDFLPSETVTALKPFFRGWSHVGAAAASLVAGEPFVDNTLSKDCTGRE